MVLIKSLGFTKIKNSISGIPSNLPIHIWHYQAQLKVSVSLKSKTQFQVFLQICQSTFDTIKRKSKSLQEDTLWNYLQTLEKLLPNVRADFVVLYPQAKSDFETLAQINSLSQRNRTKLESLKAQAATSDWNNYPTQFSFSFVICWFKMPSCDTAKVY